MSGQPHPGPPPGDHGRSAEGRPGDSRDLWPRDFGRDGVSGLVNLDRAMRSRDVSRPSAADEVAAEAVLADLLARIEGRPRNDSRTRTNRPSNGSSQNGPSQPVPHPPPQRTDS